MVTVHISRKARLDLDKVKAFIALDNPQRAHSFCEQLLTNCFNTISQFPLSCPIYSKNRRIRRFVFEKYNVYYQVSADGKRVDVLHIINAALLKNMTLKNL